VTLVLQAVDVRGPSRWRWLLTDEATGNPLADHQVAVDGDEARLVAELGAWAGTALLGERIVKAAPVTVRVTADFAARWPLELAHVAGMPLAARGDVSLVYAPAGEPGPPKAEMAGALRVLAVFSQPTRTSVLALRRGSAGVAAALVDALDCAVVAMRYPVDDEFAIGFGATLYEHVFSRGQPVDVAVARALTRASGVALATPGVFGARAAGLVLPVPRGTPRLDPDETPTAYLPPEPAPVRGPGGGDGAGQCGAGAAERPDRGAAARHGRGGQDLVRGGTGLPASGQFRGGGVLAGAGP
jgi:hypothetical protein